MVDQFNLGAGAMPANFKVDRYIKIETLKH
jgi:hypothetical protein